MTGVTKKQLLSFECIQEHDFDKRLFIALVISFIIDSRKLIYNILLCQIHKKEKKPAPRLLCEMQRNGKKLSLL